MVIKNILLLKELEYKDNRTINNTSQFFFSFKCFFPLQIGCQTFADL